MTKIFDILSYEEMLVLGFLVRNCKEAGFIATTYTHIHNSIPVSLEKVKAAIKKMVDVKYLRIIVDERANLILKIHSQILYKYLKHTQEN